MALLPHCTYGMSREHFMHSNGTDLETMLILGSQLDDFPLELPVNVAHQLNRNALPECDQTATVDAQTTNTQNQVRRDTVRQQLVDAAARIMQPETFHVNYFINTPYHCQTAVGTALQALCARFQANTLPNPQAQPPGWQSVVICE